MTVEKEVLDLNDAVEETKETKASSKKTTKKKDDTPSAISKDTNFVELRKKLSDKEHPLSAAQIVDLLDGVIDNKNYNKLLSAVNCDQFVDSRDGAKDKATGKPTILRYMTWATVEEIMSLLDLDFDYSFDKFTDPFDGMEKEYIPDFRLNQVFVRCHMTFLGIHKTETLPIQGGWGNAPIALTQLTVNDINRAQKRCMVKTAAKYGLGRYLYKGDDLPSEVEMIQMPTQYIPNAVQSTTNRVEDATLHPAANRSEPVSVVADTTGINNNAPKNVQDLIKQRNAEKATIETVSTEAVPVVENSKQTSNSTASHPESTMSFEDAKKHAIDGVVLYDYLMNQKSNVELDKAKRVLREYYFEGEGDDKQCAIALYNAIKSGQMVLPKF